MQLRGAFSPAAHRGQKVHLASLADRLEQAKPRELAIHGYGDAWAEAVPITEAVPHAGVGAVERVNDLPDVRTR
jgi:hypothetical protein